MLQPKLWAKSSLSAKHYMTRYTFGMRVPSGKVPGVINPVAKYYPAAAENP